jgi:hypothetical protein
MPLAKVMLQESTKILSGDIRRAWNLEVRRGKEPHDRDRARAERLGHGLSSLGPTTISGEQHREHATARLDWELDERKAEQVVRIAD